MASLEPETGMALLLKRLIVKLARDVTQLGEALGDALSDWIRRCTYVSCRRDR